MMEASDPGPYRDDQFRHIAKMLAEVQSEGNPAISIDTKKKENIGCFKNEGTEWRSYGNPRNVNDHDFAKLKASPYGIYDINANKGFVNLGTSSDTAKFAVESIRRWWYAMGSRQYPNATRIFITADGGGSNGSNRRMFKKYLCDLSAEIKLPIYVCHYPPGTSKYNKIEHRMFAQISMSMQAQPLETVEMFQNLISHTTTTTGLSIECQIDKNIYPTGEKITDKEFKRLNWKCQSVDENIRKWNYIIGE